MHQFPPRPLLAALLLALAACSSDDDATPESLSDASPDSGTETATDAPLDRIAETEAATDAPVDAPPGADFAMFVGSDFATTAELAVVDPSTATVIGNLTSPDQDSIVVASGGRGAFLHRTEGAVGLLNPVDPSISDHEIDVGPGSNPHAVVVASANHAYVVRYGANAVAVIDPEAGTMTGEVDLSAYVADLDGLVDAFGGVYDAASARVYVGLQRIDQTEYGDPPDYVAACTSVPALLVGIDVNTDSIVDLNGGAPGDALEIAAVNPSVMVWDDTSNRVLLLGVGCAEGTDVRRGRGVEAVDPTSGSSSWLWQTGELDRPSGFLWISETEAVIGLDDESFAHHWWRWNPSSPNLGSELVGVPEVPVADGAGGLLGIALGPGIDVVRYDLSSEQTSVVVGNAFTTAGLVPYSSAWVR